MPADSRTTQGGVQVSADANIKTITGIYEAFGRGDVAAILDAVTDDVDWAAEAVSSAAPWYGVRHGRDAVAAFFADFGSAMEVEEFSPVCSLPTRQTCSLWSSTGAGHAAPARPRR
jgi:SnoaL-like domain